VASPPPRLLTRPPLAPQLCRPVKRPHLMRHTGQLHHSGGDVISFNVAADCPAGLPDEYDASMLIPTATDINPSQASFGASAIKAESNARLPPLRVASDIGTRSSALTCRCRKKVVSWDCCRMWHVPRFVVNGSLDWTALTEGRASERAPAVGQPQGVLGNTGTGTARRMS